MATRDRVPAALLPIADRAAHNAAVLASGLSARDKRARLVPELQAKKVGHGQLYDPDFGGGPVLDPNLQGWWRFADLQSAENQGVGGAGLDAVLSGTAALTAAGLVLDGSANCFARVTDNALLNYAAGVPFTFWFRARVDSLASDFSRPFDRTAGGSANYAVQFIGGVVNVRIGGANRGGSAESVGNTFTAAGATDATSTQWYQNGLAISDEGIIGANNTASDLTFGANLSGSNRFTGVIVEARIYDRHLDAAEIAALG